MTPDTSLHARIWGKLMLSVHPWFMLSRVLVRKMHSGNQGTISPPGGISIRQATVSDLLQAMNDWPSGTPSHTFVDAAYKRGDICIGAFADSKLVAFVWRSFSTAPHKSNIFVEVQAPCWYTYNMMTQAKFRGKGLGGLLTLFGDQYCQNKGCHSGVGFVETHNYASLQANFKVGSKSVGFAGYLKIFGRTFTFRTPGVVPYTFRFIAINDT